MKKKLTKIQKRERLAMIITLAVFIVMLCVPFVNEILIGIFGYAVYAYVAAFGVSVLFLWKGYKISLPKKRIALYAAIFAFIVLTLHIGFTRQLIEGGFNSYIFDAFFTATPGGVLASLISAIIAVPLGYLTSLILFFIVAASLVFFAIFPLFIKKNPDEKNQKIKQKFLHRLSFSAQDDDMREDRELKTLEIKDEEPKEPLSVEDYDDAALRPRTKEDVRKLLFGDRPKPKTAPLRNYSPDELKLKKEPENEKNPYEILPNFEAPLIKPKDEWYTNDFIRNKKADKAKEVLLSATTEEVYQSRYGHAQEQETEAVKTFDIKPYAPSSDTAQRPFHHAAPSQDRVTEGQPYQTAQPRQEVAEQRPPHTAQNENRASQPYRSSVSNGLREDKKQNARDNAANISSPPPPAPKRPYIYPHPGLLKQHVAEGYDGTISSAEYEKYKEVLERTLEDFGITATVFNAIKGPTVTRYELRLAQGAGNSVNKVLSLHKDLKMVLEAEGEINILAPIRGKNAIGIEIPNKHRGIVSLRETICAPEFQNDKKGIKLALGKMLDGRPYIGDLEDMPHLLVAGATGTGKSVCINTIITSILFQHSPDEVKLLLIDPKKVELINYIGLPHLLISEPLVEINDIVTALKWIREETEQRFNLFKDMRVVNINAYNNYAKNNGMQTIHKIVIVIDEASELMTRAKKEVEDTLSSLARIGRAAGVHLIFATQSPTKDVITSEIQNNLNTKIAFAVSDYVHSQVIFKTAGAEKLLGKGDMFLKGSGGELTRIQCSYVDPEEIQNVVKYIIDNNEAYFDQAISDAIFKKAEQQQQQAASASETKSVGAKDDTFMDSVKEALKIGIRTKRISTSMLQRKLEKGYNSAAKIMDYLEENNFIGPPDSGNKKREVLISVEEFLRLFPEERDNMAEFGLEADE